MPSHCVLSIIYCISTINTQYIWRPDVLVQLGHIWGHFLLILSWYSVVDAYRMRHACLCQHNVGLQPKPSAYHRIELLSCIHQQWQTYYSQAIHNEAQPLRCPPYSYILYILHPTTSTTSSVSSNKATCILRYTCSTMVFGTMNTLDKWTWHYSYRTNLAWWIQHWTNVVYINI